MKTKTSKKIGIVIGILLCVVSIPVIVFNLYFIIQGFVAPDKAPQMMGKVPLIVLTESMDPTIQGGDLIVCDSTDSSFIKNGDVVSYFDPSKSNSSVIVTHRVSEVTQSNGDLSFKTKGDANNTIDKVPVPASKIVGIWTGTRIPGLGNFCMWLKSVPGIIVCVGIPLLLLITYDIIRRRKYSKQQRQTEDQLRAELEQLKAQSVAKDAQFNNTVGV